MQEDTKRILVGHITGIYGVKGWLKIKSYTRPAENIFSYKPWYIKQDSDWREMNLLEGKTHGKGLIAALEQLNDRDVARGLIGSDISILRSQLPELKKGEYYWHDLIGMQVIDQENKVLGHLKQIVETGANEVMVVVGDDRRLIPLVWEHYVQEVNHDEGIIRVDWEDPE